MTDRRRSPGRTLGLGLGPDAPDDLNLMIWWHTVHGTFQSYVKSVQTYGPDRWDEGRHTRGRCRSSNGTGLSGVGLSKILEDQNYVPWILWFFSLQVPSLAGRNRCGP